MMTRSAVVFHNASFSDVFLPQRCITKRPSLWCIFLNPNEVWSRGWVPACRLNPHAETSAPNGVPIVPTPAVTPDSRSHSRDSAKFEHSWAGARCGCIDFSLVPIAQRERGNRSATPRVQTRESRLHRRRHLPASDSIPRASSSGRVKTGVALPKTLATKGTVLAIVSDAKEIVGKEIIDLKKGFLSFLARLPIKWQRLVWKVKEEKVFIENKNVLSFTTRIVKLNSINRVSNKNKDLIIRIILQEFNAESINFCRNLLKN